MVSFENQFKMSQSKLKEEVKSFMKSGDFYYCLQIPENKLD